MSTPAFLFYPGDYLRDTQMLSSNSQVAYDRMMCESKRSPIINETQLNFLTKKLTDDERAELMNVLTAVEGGYEISWVARSIEKRERYVESRRRNKTNYENKKNPLKAVTIEQQPSGAHQAQGEPMADQVPESEGAGLPAVIDHLNAVADVMYPFDYPTSQLMLALLTEGYSCAMMIDVIDLKLRQTQVKGKGGPAFQRRWLSPHTLFSKLKFPKYANEVRDIKQGHTAAPAQSNDQRLQKFADDLEEMGL